MNLLPHPKNNKRNHKDTKGKTGFYKLTIQINKIISIDMIGEILIKKEQHRQPLSSCGIKTQNSHTTKYCLTVHTATCLPELQFLLSSSPFKRQKKFIKNKLTSHNYINW